MSIEDIALEYNRATTLLHKNQPKKAIPILKKCLAQYEFKEGYVNLGNCYRLEGKPNQLLVETYLKALDDNILSLERDPLPVVGHALNNLGLTYYSMGDDKKAIHCYKKAIGLNEKFWEAWWNLSTAKLRVASSGRGDFASAWEMYDARFLKNPPIKLKNNKEDLVYWDTVSSGTSICILAEQGIGDDIMFGRYLSLLPFEKVYVQCDPSLNVLFPGFECVTDAVECDAMVAYPMCSLAKCFNNGVPIAGDWLRGKFGTREFDKNRFNVGIVWAGSPAHANNHNRSVSIGRFSRLASICNLYSLTPGFKSTKYVRGLDIKSWTDTAECINGLDLVISVDTSVIHLCGALGHEGWVLQPSMETDFRWGNGVSRSLWYSDIEIFENPGSWESVFDLVELRLRERLYEKC